MAWIAYLKGPTDGVDVLTLEACRWHGCLTLRGLQMAWMAYPETPADGKDGLP